MTEGNLISELDLFDGYYMKLYSSPYKWSDDTEMDITNDIIGPVVVERTNNFHTASFSLRNTSRRYIYTESDYNIMQKPRARFKMGNRSFKFTVLNVEPNVDQDTIGVQMVSHSYDLKGAIAQIRVQNDIDGNYYLEDVLYSALYDTGMQNFFVIKLSDGTYYDSNTPPEKKNKIDSLDDIVYMRVSVFDVLNDICSKAGCIWYEEDLSSNELLSVINILKIESDFDAPESKTIRVSTSKNTENFKPKKGFDTVSNLIYFDKLPFMIAEHDSMDRYGIRNPRSLSFDTDNGDAGKSMTSALSLRSVIKDPLVTFKFDVKGLVDITSLDRFVKIINESDNYDKYAGIDRKYRINSVSYDFSNEKTTFTIGNEYRKIIEEKIIDMSNENKNDSDSGGQQLIGKGPTDSELRVQVYTDETYHDDTFTATSGEYGIRIDVDYAYQAIYSPNARFYMEDDGVRTGN